MTTRAGVRRCWAAVLIAAAVTLAACTPAPTGRPGISDGGATEAPGIRPPATGQPARFRVGTAVRSVDPPPGLAVRAGGYSFSPPITAVADPLQVRAMYVSSGDRAVAFAVIDSQGAFAFTQQGPDLGVDAIRRFASVAASGPGRPTLDADHIVVQATHSHGAPTIQGIWGPVPLDYLTLVRDRTVEAIAAAARAARPATLSFGLVDAPQLVARNLAQYNVWSGWAVDASVSALVARDRDTRRVIASYVTVPVHPVFVNGAKERVLSADYVGVARRLLDRRLGGLTLVGPGTLGRQNPPGGDGFERAEFFGAVVAGEVERAVASGAALTDGTLGGVASDARIPITNPLLRLGVDAWSAPPFARDLLVGLTGVYPFSRSNVAPAQTGGTVHSPVTTLRVGDVAYAGMPGEPFPEVHAAVSRAVLGARATVTLSKVNDDLGYLVPSEVYGANSAFENDQTLFNVSPAAAREVAVRQVDNARDLGFDTTALGPLEVPRGGAQLRLPGLQVLAAPAFVRTRGREATVRLRADFTSSVSFGVERRGPIEWDFGDGATATSEPDTIIEHRFAPGTWNVVATGRDAYGNVARWTTRVRVVSTGSR